MRTEQPTYEHGQPMQITPKGTALQRTVDASISASTEVELHADTTFLRCYAITEDIYFRWGIEDCNANTFDEVIPAGQIVDLSVPVDSQGVKFTHFNVIERVSGATIIVVEK